MTVWSSTEAFLLFCQEACFTGSRASSRNLLGRSEALRTHFLHTKRKSPFPKSNHTAKNTQIAASTMKRSSLFRFLFSTLLVCTAVAATIEWEQQQEVTDRQAKRWAEFGRAVAVYENTLVVGAYGAERSGSDSNTEAGSVTIFDYDHQSASWKAVQKLQASDAVPGDYFGDSVALQDDTLVVGAWGRDGYKGKVYIFTLRENGEWKETQSLVAPVSEIYAGAS